MPPVSEAAFARRWRSLSPADRAAFVADLWAARGFETSREGAVVTVEGSPSGALELDCRAGGGAALVRRGVATGTQDVVEPAALRGMLLYAVDRDRAARLFERHFGRPLRSDREPRTGRLRSPRGRRVLLAGLAIALAVGLAAGGGGFGALETRFGAADPVPAGGAVPTVVLTDEPVGSGDAEQPQGGGDLFRYPPGVGPTGVDDVDALAAAHRSALANGTWALRLELNRSHDLLHPFTRWRTAEQTVVRSGPARYRFTVDGLADVEHGSLTRVTYTDYGDGTANYRRFIGLHGDAYRRTKLPAEGPPGVFTLASTAYVSRYLSTPDSRVETVRVDGTTLARVTATGTPTAMARTVGNYTAVALVDRRGVVRSLAVEYTLLRRVPEPTPNGIATPYASPTDVETEVVGRVRFRMTLAAANPAELDAPGWYPRALNATNGTDLPPWPNDPAV